MSPAEILTAAADRLEAKLDAAAWCTCGHPPTRHENPRRSCMDGYSWKSGATCPCREFTAKPGTGEVHVPWPMGQKLGRPLVELLRAEAEIIGRDHEPIWREYMRMDDAAVMAHAEQSPMFGQHLALARAILGEPS